MHATLPRNCVGLLLTALDLGSILMDDEAACAAKRFASEYLRGRLVKVARARIGDGAYQ
jgi:hypothetical protein